MKSHRFAGILFLVTALFLLKPLQGQENLLAEQGEDTTAVQIIPFQTSAIAEAFSESFEVINKAGNEQLEDDVFEGFREEVDTLFSTIDQFLSDTALQKFSGIGIRELDNIVTKSNLHLESIKGLKGRLAKMAKTAEGTLKTLHLYDDRWDLTVEIAEPDDIPESRRARIGRTVRQIDSVSTLLQDDLDAILVLQDRLSEKGNSLDALQIRIRDHKVVLGEKMFSRDMPAFFKDTVSLNDSTLVRKHVDQLKKSVRSDVEIFRSKFMAPMILISLLFLFFLGFSIWYKTHFAKLISVEKFELSDMHMTVIYSPAIAVLFMSALLIRFLFADLPQTFRFLNMLIMMGPMLIIVVRLFGSLARTWMSSLVAIFCLTFLYEMIYYPDLIIRIILLFLSVAAFLLYVWMIIKKPLSDRFKNLFLYQLFRIILAGFALMLLVAIIGNLVGAFRMAEFFTLIPIQLAVLAIGTHVTIKVADAVLFLLLASNNMQKLNVIREEFDIIYRKIVQLVTLLMWIFFFVTALSIFRVKDAFMEWGDKLLTEGWKIGAVDITPGSILIFVFVLWLSIVITRIVRHVLEKDVFARVSVAKGMPGTIILLLRIGLISGGFFLAAAAAGMKLTNLSIVLGAFSVGIGFGLQNIFNNMVSGLILAFERPINVGDTVQVGELMGIVRSIGLRSSTVRSFDGAEVIVPNGNLISNQMINWTKSDTNRRMDIRVGVTYGTDPEKVLGLMADAANEHKLVSRLPRPKAYFLGFGESSLDFRLLAWADIDSRLSVESELNVAVNTKLKAAGIEIPFPQRDLHIRSDATKS